MTQHRKVTQPSAVPTRKIAAVGISGTVAAVLVWVVNVVFGYQLAPEHAAALAGILVFAAGYLTKSTAPPPPKFARGGRVPGAKPPVGKFERGVREIGRASCRERVWIPV